MVLIALGVPQKMVFGWGWSAPNWGRYGGLKFAFLAIFGPKFLENPFSDSENFLHADTSWGPLGMVKIWGNSDPPMGVRIFGVGQIWGLTPIFLSWSPSVIGLCTLRKMVLIWGWSPPIWRRYGGSKLHLGGYWPPNCRNFRKIFPNFFSPFVRNWVGLYTVKIIEKSVKHILRKVESNFCHFGVGALLGFTPLGGPYPRPDPCILWPCWTWKK